MPNKPFLVRLQVGGDAGDLRAVVEDNEKMPVPHQDAAGLPPLVGRVPRQKFAQFAFANEFERRNRRSCDNRLANDTHASDCGASAVSFCLQLLKERIQGVRTYSTV